MTTVGHASGGRTRDALGLTGRGPSRVITDLGVLGPDADTRELTLVAVHQGVTVDEVRRATGWTLRVADDVRTLPPPSLDELARLRDLQAQTKAARARP